MDFACGRRIVKRSYLTSRLAVSLALWLVAAVMARADGLIIIHDPPHIVPGHFTFAPLEVSYHRVNVEINDLVATTSIDQEFRNPNNQRLEGTYIFPLPVGAHIDKFSMDINGKMMEAELLPADKARAFYEDIVRKMKDPALMEYVGRDAFKVRIFPIEPNSKKQIKISYTQLLKSDSGLVEYLYPLNTEKFSSVPLKDVSVKVTLNTKEPMKTVYCPSHNVEIKRDGDRKAVVGYEEKNVRPDSDFRLMFSRTQKLMGVDLLTHRKPGEDGYFLLLASPGFNEPQNVQPKDICFVLDTSGSMADTKLDQARKALKFCLANLNEKDNFEIIRFSTEAEPFFKQLTPATKDNLKKATDFVEGFKPIGGTAISEALTMALGLRGKEGANGRPYMVVFITDGLPTIGETREDSIIELIKKRNDAGTRVFAFGLGTDVNTHLLDRLADETRGISQYVLPKEDLELKLSAFYSKIKEPVLSNVSLDFTVPGIRVTQVYPNAMPDLFNGDMLVVFGRYSGEGASAAKITGTLNGKKREFATDVTFPAKDSDNAFVPRLWATRRVGWLLDEIRLHGEKAEIRDEVTKLARDFGIVTPYTAYLIVEDETRRNVPVAMQNFREMKDDHEVHIRSKVAMDSMKGEAREERLRSGAPAVENAQAVSDLKYGWNEQQSSRASGMAKAPAAAGPTGGYKVAQNYTQQARVVNGRAFYQNGKQWVDSTAQAQNNLKQQRVAFNSTEYFELMRKNPTAAPWFALGNEVDVVIGDILYQVREI
ncbi:MAG: trypsin [Verrucomicrobia bacterium]|nr:trypsin [Verrucomicrobiota bacterium]